MDFFWTLFDYLFGKLEVHVLAAILGVSWAIQKARMPERIMPLVPVFLGAGAAYYLTDEDLPLWMLYYGGGASVVYNILWTTLMAKTNLLDLAGDLLLKWKNRKAP